METIIIANEMINRALYLYDSLFNKIVYSANKGEFVYIISISTDEENKTHFILKIGKNRKGMVGQRIYYLLDCQTDIPFNDTSLKNFIERHSEELKDVEDKLSTFLQFIQTLDKKNKHPFKFVKFERREVNENYYYY